MDKDERSEAPRLGLWPEKAEMTFARFVRFYGGLVEGPIGETRDQMSKRSSLLEKAAILHTRNLFTLLISPHPPTLGKLE